MEKGRITARLWDQESLHENTIFFFAFEKSHLSVFWSVPNKPTIAISFSKLRASQPVRVIMLQVSLDIYPSSNPCDHRDFSLLEEVFYATALRFNWLTSKNPTARAGIIPSAVTRSQVACTTVVCPGHAGPGNRNLLLPTRTKAPAMRQDQVILFFLNLTLPVVVGATGTAYQWTDKHGQVHYGDTPSASDNPREIILQRDTTGVESQGDLRPGEREQIQQMKQRQMQQQRRAQTRGIRADRQRASRRADCASNREMLKTSRGRDAFKQHARYLRNNCW